MASHSGAAKQEIDMTQFNSIQFIEREQDWQNEATRYWFDVDGDEYAVVESGPESSIINRAGEDVYDRDLESRLAAALVVTDEMRAA